MKRQRKQQIVECHFCQAKFLKDCSEVNRSESRGMKHYCSLSCSGNVTKHLLQKGGHPENLRIRERDEYSEFRVFLRRVKTRQKQKQVECDLTINYLKDTWDSQNGFCPYTGIKMQLPSTSCKINSPLVTASLDRIDSSKGYLMGNVQFVPMSINYMKNAMTDEQTKELIRLIRAPIT